MSLIKKLFAWKYFTTGIVPLAGSWYIPKFGKFGFYDEITPQWYVEKGVSLMISSFIRIFVLGMVGLVRWGLPRLKVLYDTNWTGDREETRKTNYRDYQNVYKTMEFDLELSYAEAMTSIYLAMTYGFLMPIMYAFVFLQLVVLYFRDKLLNTNTYMYFSFFGYKIHTFTREMLAYPFAILCIVMIWVFGNNDYFSLSRNLSQGTVQAEVVDIYTLNVADGSGISTPDRLPGYTFTLLRRMQESNFSRLIIWVTLGYLIWVCIRYIYMFI
jgi:hypothetical protein